jgi:hypothetical protein
MDFAVLFSSVATDGANSTQSSGGSFCVENRIL